MSVPERNNNSDLIKLKRNELSLGKNQVESACADIGQPQAFWIVDFRWNKHFSKGKILKFTISSISQTLLLDF